MNIFDDHTGDILDGLRKPEWELPDYNPDGSANPKGDALRQAEEERDYLRSRCTASEAERDAAREDAARLREEAMWVSVIDELPPEGVDVEFMQIHRGTRHGKQWLDNEAECAYRGITHWRPLPEPPTLTPAEGETE